MTTLPPGYEIFPPPSLLGSGDLASIPETHAGVLTTKATTPAGVASVVCSVKAYGAVGNGATDDTAAIQSAITAIGAATGGTIYFPAGTYLVSTTISLQNLRSIKLTGSGFSGQYAPASKLRWTGAAGGTLINMNGTDSVVLEDIGLYGDNAAYQTDNTQIGISAIGNPAFLGSAYCQLIRCYFQNFAICVNLGQNTDSVDIWSFEKCTFAYGITGIGVQLNSSNCTQIGFNSCAWRGHLNGTTSMGVYVVGNYGGGIRLYNCLSIGNKYGVYIDSHFVPSCEIFAHHSELEGYAVYLPVHAHDPAIIYYSFLLIDGLFNYESRDGLFYFGNHMFIYSVNSVRSDSNGNQTITIADTHQDKVWLWNVIQTPSLSIRNVTGAVVKPNGIFTQGGVNPVGVYFDHKVLAVAGLGVGNSVAATILGSVTKKIQVFDETGVSIGYLPVYDAIT